MIKGVFFFKKFSDICPFLSLLDLLAQVNHIAARAKYLFVTRFSACPDQDGVAGGSVRPLLQVGCHGGNHRSGEGIELGGAIQLDYSQ